MMILGDQHVKERLKEQIAICRGLECFLDDIIEHRRGSEWACEQVEEFVNYCRQLRLSAHTGEPLNPEPARESFDLETLNLARDLHRRMLNVRNLLQIWQSRIGGGHQLLLSELKKLLRGMDLKGYGKQHRQLLNHGVQAY